MQNMAIIKKVPVRDIFHLQEPPLLLS